VADGNQESDLPVRRFAGVNADVTRMVSGAIRHGWTNPLNFRGAPVAPRPDAGKRMEVQ